MFQKQQFPDFLVSGLYKWDSKVQNNVEPELYFVDQVRKMPNPFTHNSSWKENAQNLKLNCRHVYLLIFVWLTKKRKIKGRETWNPTKLGKKHWAHITQRQITFASFKLN